MKKLKIASFLTLLVPFIMIAVCYLSTELLEFNWALLLMNILVLLFAMPICGFVSLILNSIIIKKQGFGFVSFNLFVFSLLEFTFGMFCLFQVFFVRYY